MIHLAFTDLGKSVYACLSGVLSGAWVLDSRGLGYQMSKYSWPTLHSEDTTNRCTMLYEKGRGGGQTQ